MRTSLSVFALALAGCTGGQSFREGGIGGTSSGAGGEDGFLDIAGECPCTDLGGFERLSVFTDPGTPCPDGTAGGITVHAELNKPDPTHTCSACNCSPSTCALPEGMHTNAAKCPGDGSTSTPFGPAALSDGVCSSEGALAAGLDCDGVACVQSLTVPAMEVSCAASVPLPSLPPATWGRTLRECRSTSPAICPAGQACEPFVPEGALGCFYRRGIHEECPAGFDRLVFYLGIKDDRACEACSCSSPAGAACEAVVSVFSDSVCSVIAGTVMVSVDDASCVDLLPGTALGSSVAWFVTQEPGACAPDPDGGKPIGDIEPAGPMTLCCKAATVLE